MPPTPLLIISDAPTAGSGLGRITRDLATRIAIHMPEAFRVGCLGYGGPGSCKLPFPQYTIEGMHDWVIPTLPEVCEDFFGEEKVRIMTIWDASRLMWLSRPETCEDKYLSKWLQAKKPELWGYFPIDATGPFDKLSAAPKYTMEKFDRVLCYSEWAQDIVTRTLSYDWIKTSIDGINWLPHGIDCSVFYPRNRTQARHGFGRRIGAFTAKGKEFSVPDDALMIGIVATNQTRKDFGLGIQTVAELAKEHNVYLWIHTDKLERAWSIPALLTDFNLSSKTVVTQAAFTDEQMAWLYCACDVTLGIGLGEGYGYPIFESLACGTPCIHGNYGGAAEHIPDHMLVDPADSPHEIEYRLEGLYNCYRPVYSPKEWAWRVQQQKGKNWDFPRHLDWTELWPRWEQWLRKGVNAEEKKESANGIGVCNT